jgi:hypothetical protein
MAAGLVSHNITTATGVTFAVVSWVPDTTAPDVGAVPIMRVTDGTNVAPVSATNGLKVDVATLPTLPAGTNNIGDVDVLTLPALPAGAATIGAVNQAGAWSVSISGSVTVSAHNVTNAGTFVVQENGAALTSLQLMDDIILSQGSALGSTKQALVGASVTTAAPTYTTGQVSPLSLDAAGNLRVALPATQIDGANFKACPAGATTTLAQSGAGATGDLLTGIILTPLALTGLGVVSYKNGSATAVELFHGGDVPDMRPIPLFGPGLSTLGAWQIICGANVQVTATGTF